MSLTHQKNFKTAALITFDWGLQKTGIYTLWSYVTNYWSSTKIDHKSYQCQNASYQSWKYRSESIAHSNDEAKNVFRPINRNKYCEQEKQNKHVAGHISIAKSEKGREHDTE